MKSGPPKRYVTRAREELVWELATRGLTLRTIAAAVEESGLGRMSFQAVAFMLHRLEDRFLARMAERANAEKIRQHAVHELIAREAWDAWNRSKRSGRIRKVKTTTLRMRQGDETIEVPSEEVTWTVKGQTGDPRYLDTVIKAKAAQRAIWGLDAAPTDSLPDQGAADPQAARRAMMAAEGGDEEYQEDEGE